MTASSESGGSDVNVDWIRGHVPTRLTTRSYPLTSARARRSMIGAIRAVFAKVTVPDSISYCTSRKVMRPPSSKRIWPRMIGCATVPRATRSTSAVSRATLLRTSSAAAETIRTSRMVCSFHGSRAAIDPLGRFRSRRSATVTPKSRE